MIPESNILNSVFIPKYFKSKLVSKDENSLIEDTDFEFETDRLGRRSIIKLNKIPYFDLNMWDHQRRRWFETDRFGNKWRTYVYPEWVIEDNIEAEQSRNSYLVSKSGMFGGKVFRTYDSDGNYTPERKLMEDQNIVLKNYAPISIILKNMEFKDITNYSSTISVVPKLNFINPEDEPQFYFDKKNRIYSNIDFAAYSIDDFNISYNVVVDNIKVSATLSTNSTQYTYNTPIVDYYILKLVGQSI